MAHDDTPHEADGYAVTMRIDVAVLKEKVGSIDKKMDALAASLLKVYATKAEVMMIRDDLDGLKSNQRWIIKLIVGAVVAAVLALVFVKGGPMRSD